jgi:DNA-binding MurR/RpiR family transcriptional regulator
MNEKEKINSILLNHADSLTNTDIKILKYISKVQIEGNIFSLKIEDIANKMNVSNSKITKTIQKCGFSGYKDFKQYIYLENKKPSQDNAIMQYLNNTLIHSLDKTFENISNYDFHVFNGLIESATNIVFLSGGLNHHIASIFAAKFNKIGKKSKAIEISNPECNNITENSLLIVISLSGKNYKIKNRIKYIKENVIHTKIISITLANKSNIFDYATKEHSLYFVDYENLNEREIPRHSLSIISVFLDMFFLEYYKIKSEKFDHIINTNADKIT